MSSTNDEILHYQRKIVKYSSDNKVLIHCLNKLTKLPIGVEHLQATGIGRTINGMRKAEGPVGEEARALVNKWKEMVAAEDKSDSDGQESHKAASDNSPDASPSQKKPKQKESHKEEPSTSKSKSSSSRSKSPDKHASKSGKEKRKESSKSKSSRKRNLSQEDSASQPEEEDDGPTLSFADALGSIETVSKKKKSKEKEKPKEEKKKNLLPPAQLMVLTKPMLPPARALVDIRPVDFEISPHYKPLPLKFSSNDPLSATKEKMKLSEEALSVAMLQKGSRTKVFSGNKSSGLSYVPSLYDICVRVLNQNIDALEFTGGVPFELLRPVLERATAQQLYLLENYNPYLLDDTDELWKILCQKEYRKAIREEMESWRDLYLRCHEEREARLKSLTNNHKQSMAKATPVRTTKLAYVECVAKAPRGVAKPGLVKQGASAVFASMTNAKAGARPFEASMNHAGNGAAVAAEIVKMGPPSGSRSTSSSSSSSAPAAKKPKVAPLMQKTLKLMKNRYRR